MRYRHWTEPVVVRPWGAAERTVRDAFRVVVAALTAADLVAVGFLFASRDAATRRTFATAAAVVAGAVLAVGWASIWLDRRRRPVPWWRVPPPRVDMHHDPMLILVGLLPATAGCLGAGAWFFITCATATGVVRGLFPDVRPAFEGWSDRFGWPEDSERASPDVWTGEGVFVVSVAALGGLLFLRLVLGRLSEEFDRRRRLAPPACLTPHGPPAHTRALRGDDA
ncbi:MAG TPA: hypothetical protein VEI02_17205 [Planctomycetota bacterium]|nr:hypothetical protein [Planctomycetota bacterium]